MGVQLTDVSHRCIYMYDENSASIFDYPIVMAMLNYPNTNPTDQMIDDMDVNDWTRYCIHAHVNVRDKD
jgi:hypothetical protein